MNVTYAINIKDLRVVSATCETLKQPDYRKISEETAIAIEKGKLLAKDVASELLFGKRVEPLPADVKTTMNVRTKEMPDQDKEDDEETIDPDVVPPVVEPAEIPPVVVDPPAPAPTAEELEAMTVPNLKVKAAEMGIAGYNKMKADELKAAILGSVK